MAFELRGNRLEDVMAFADQAKRAGFSRNYGPVRHNGEPPLGDGETGGNVACYFYDPDYNNVEFCCAMDTIENYRAATAPQRARRARDARRGMVGACIMWAPAARDDCSELMGDCEYEPAKSDFRRRRLGRVGRDTAARRFRERTTGCVFGPRRRAAAEHRLHCPDDQGWKDVGYHGSDIRCQISTLGEGGARLEQFYAQPMCTPTRAALMTGRYPFR